MDRLALRGLVRAISRTEEHDVDDVTMDIYLDEGYEEILSNRVWPWAYALAPEPVVMVVDQVEYPLDTKVKRVLAVIEKEQRYPLTQVSQSDWARQQDSIQSTSRPIWYSFTRSTLYVWPTPASTDTLDVYYYEHPEWGDQDTDVPLFEVAFHTAIVDWALVRLWEQEEDLEKSDMYRQRFELKMNRMSRFYNTEMTDRPMVYGETVTSRPTSMPWLGDARLGGATN